METCNVKYPVTAFMSQCKLCYPFDSTHYHDHVSSCSTQMSWLQVIYPGYLILGGEGEIVRNSEILLTIRQL